MQNSTNTWRHAPQGYGSAEPVEIITMSEKSFAPAVMAEKMAFLSAHIVSPNDAFSTLQPENIWPSAVSNAAPTLKFE